jgi:5-deoxy-glucuronate isomerase
MKQPKLHFRNLVKDSGCCELVSPASAPLEHITLGVQSLRAGEIYQFSATAREAVFVLLNGSMEVSGASFNSIPMERASVFADCASAVYVRPGDEICLRARCASEMVVAKAPSVPDERFRTQVILPRDVRRREVGKGNWHRTVFDILPGEFAADKLIIGETLNPPGNWSSSPPHKHDRDDPPREGKFEEVYFYRLDPPQGFALQRVYSADGDLDVCYAVKHNDAVVLPRGYHPVVAAPGYRLYYFWVLAGQSRNPVWSEDPAHSWIHDVAEKG